MRTPGFAIFAIRVVRSPKDQERAVINSSFSQQIHAYHSFPRSELNSKNLLFGQLSAHVKSKPQLTVEASVLAGTPATPIMVHDLQRLTRATCIRSSMSRG
jgi:hypothetical protein